MSKTSKTPLEAEAEGFAEFTFRGVALRVPTGKNIPRKAIKALELNQSVTFVEEILGPDFSKVESKVPTLGDLEELAEALTAAMNSSVGE